MVMFQEETLAIFYSSFLIFLVVNICSLGQNCHWLGHEGFLAAGFTCAPHCMFSTDSVLWFLLSPLTSLIVFTNIDFHGLKMHAERVVVDLFCGWTCPVMGKILF